MAQVVAHILGKDEVMSSSLIISSNKQSLFSQRLFIFLLFILVVFKRKAGKFTVGKFSCKYWCLSVVEDVDLL